MKVWVMQGVHEGELYSSVHMTEKGAARCHKLDIKNIWILKIEADLPENFALELLNKIKEEDE